MAYPNSLDTLTSISCLDTMNTSNKTGVDIITELQDLTDAIQENVGIVGSTVPTTIDYLLKNVASVSPGHKHVLSEITDVTASASELNVLDGAIAGTGVANKVVVLDANKDFDFDTGDITATNINADNNIVATGNITGTDITATDDITAVDITATNITATSNLNWGGWQASNETPTYSSWTSTYRTGVLTVASGAASKYTVGMKVEITQTTDGVKYGIITKVENTALTIYFGTNYDLDNETISLMRVSRDRVPTGFPLNPTLWTVTASTTANSPTESTNDTWFDFLTISVPIGIWNVDYVATFLFRSSSGVGARGGVTLSTADNSQSDANWTSYAGDNGATGDVREYDTLINSGVLNLSTAAPYYLNAYLDTGNHLQPQGDLGTIRVRAVCAYL